MIIHTPLGSGHPYRDDTEQRSPIVPVAGAPLRLGVRASPGMTQLRLELIHDDEAHMLPLARVPAINRGRATEGGHLAAAQRAAGTRAAGWEATVEDVRAGTRYRYRFMGRTTDGREQATRWFDFRAAQWRPLEKVLVENALAVVGISRVILGSVFVLDDGERISRVRFALPLEAGEHVTGLGERFDALDHRGARVDSVVFEQYKDQASERRTYLPMPFAHVVGGSGWGFHVRTSRRVWFDFGETSADRISVEAEVTDPLEVAFYNGTPREVLKAFLSEAGEPSELPSWVFRLWASSNEWNTQAEVERQVELHRTHDIPVGSVVIEAWSDETTFTAWRDARYSPTPDGSPLRLADFDFPEDGAWPDPARMIKGLHDRDIRVHLWQIPLLKTRPRPQGQLKADVDAAIRENILIRTARPDGSTRPYRNRGWWFPGALMPDLTDARAAAWWTEKRRYLVEELGIDGFKTDGGEHAWGSDLRYLDGRSGDEGNNLFPVGYAKAYGELLRSAGEAPVTFSRAGFTGSQAHGAFWAGDENSTWGAFRASMLAGLSAASSGILYWGWDIAGFSGEVPTAELYLRAAAASTFVPIMQYHSEFNFHRKPSRDRTPWNIAERSGDDRVLPVFRRFAMMRERLVPYLTEQARHSIETAAPLMRPLYFDHPADARVWDFPVQWMLGDAILVAPVIEARASTWRIYLPKGEWVDAFTGAHVEPGVVERDVPIDEIPVYVRAGDWGALSDVFDPH